MAATKVIMVRPWESLHDDLVEEIASSTNLSEEAQRVARKELREDENTRTQGLEQFRDWIKKNRDLQDCRTDSNFLLRFLRVKKFSLPMAETMLLKYLNLRQTFTHLFGNLDYLEPPILELINKGYYFASPVRDKHGRRVTIGIAKNFDPHKYTYMDMAKVLILSYETLLNDEETQVMGFTHFGDAKHASAAHVTLWSPTEFATVFKWGEQSMPMRHKEVHLLNVHPALKYVYDFTRSRLSQKIKERFSLHTSLAELHNKLDPSVLPKEYGGVIPMAEMIESWKEELAANRERILCLDKMKLLDNTCILKDKKKTNNPTTDVCITGSFRKLEVD